MESILAFLFSDLKQHPIILILCVLILWRVHTHGVWIKEVYGDFKAHLVNHAKGEL
jgi:hypothetical protein